MRTSIQSLRWYRALHERRLRTQCSTALIFLSLLGCFSSPLYGDEPLWNQSQGSRTADRMAEGGVLLRIPLGRAAGSERATVDVGLYGVLRVSGSVQGLASGAVLTPVALFRVSTSTGQLTQLDLGLGGHVLVEDIVLSSAPHILVDRSGRGILIEPSVGIPEVNDRPIPHYVEQLRVRFGRASPLGSPPSDLFFERRLSRDVPEGFEVCLRPWTASVTAPLRQSALIDLLPHLMAEDVDRPLAEGDAVTSENAIAERRLAIQGLWLNYLFLGTPALPLVRQTEEAPTDVPLRLDLYQSRFLEFLQATPR